MLRNVISPSHTVFGKDYVKLQDHMVLEPGDETACVSTLLSVEGEQWSSVDGWWPADMGLTVRAACEDHGDADGAERVFRRSKARIMEQVCQIIASIDSSKDCGSVVWDKIERAGELARLALGSKT